MMMVVVVVVVPWRWEQWWTKGTVYAIDVTDVTIIHNDDDIDDDNDDDDDDDDTLMGYRRHWTS
jgi:hypothetical protein